MEKIIPREVKEFCRLFNQEKFFEAHEVLEALWRKEGGKPRDFYQGLIQIAAALVHVQKKTHEGGLKLLEKAARHLEAYPSPLMGIDHRRLLKEARECAAEARPFPKAA